MDPRTRELWAVPRADQRAARRVSSASFPPLFRSALAGPTQRLIHGAAPFGRRRQESGSAWF